MISVIMSIYGTKLEYISLAVESIINQSLKDYEFIIVNNGGCKKIKELIETYQDDRIELLGDQ